jgi:hypothetical protein
VSEQNHLVRNAVTPGQAGIRGALAPIIIAALMLLWPALRNGYPLVFADTGTYLSQAIEHYIGWDRPVFYSLFLFPLHLTITTWPIIIVQALLTAHLLHLLRGAFIPQTSPWALLSITAALSLVTSLPWFASQIMPDLFTPLLTLALGLLLFVPERLSRLERAWLVLFGAASVSFHLSSLPLVIALLASLLPVRRSLGAPHPLGAAGLVRLLLIPGLGAAALLAVNIAASGRASLSPQGNIFLLARLLYDGPGMDALERGCPEAHWRLCPYLGHFPSSSDHFLWDRESPLWRAGGPRAVSPEAGAIIALALRTEPAQALTAFVANGLSQLTLIATGDGLVPWPDTVSPIIQKHFPAFEQGAYAASRQARGEPPLPVWLAALHSIAAACGVAGTIAVLLLCSRPIRGLAATVLLALVANALIAGGLSMPHDRYQSRIVWLAVLTFMLVVLHAVASARQRASPSSLAA